MILRKTPNGQAMGVSHELLGDNRPRNIGIALYQDAYKHVEVVMCMQGTVRCRYNAVNFLTNIHKRHPIAHPLGRGMGFLLWI